MLPFPLYEMSLRIQCPFALPWLCSLRCTALQFFSLCSVTIFYSPFSPYLISSHCPFIFHIALSLSSFFISVSYPSLFALLASTLTDIWHKWQYRSCVQARYQARVFYWTSFSAPVKTGTSWMCAHCTFELMMCSGDTFWKWSTNAEVVTDCGLT